MTTPQPRLTWQHFTIKFHNPFRVSYGTSATRPASWLRLAGDEGWGEGTIPPYYGVETAAIEALWRSASARQDPFPDDPGEISSWIGRDGPAPARAALDLALHDRLGKLNGRPIHALLDLPQPQVLASSFTIGIDTPEVMAAAASRIPDFPIIKVKLGSDDDRARLAAIRAARPDVILRIDANAAWTADEAIWQIEQILPYDLEMIEQPVARDDFAGMAAVQAACPIPVVADESVQSLADVEKLAAGGVQGINVKLMKVGGLGPAVQILERARVLGLRVMLGCMIETSLGVTAMAHLSGFAEWLDLDAPLLIANDPFDGVIIDAGARVHLPGRVGIGADRNQEELIHED